MFKTPKEAYSYWPTGEHCLIETKELVERLIFSRQDYQPWEISGLSQLCKLSKDSTHLKNIDEAEQLRFLYGSGWKISETIKCIEDHVNWKQEWPSQALLFPMVNPILTSGGIYIHGRDHRYRPLIVLVPEKLIDFPQHLLMATSYYLLEYIKEHMLIPGQVENWNLIIDLQGFEIKEYLRKFISELLLHYPCRLAKAFVFNSSKQLACISKLFSKNTLQKIHFVENSNELLRICNPTQVEEKFGGCAENACYYWPPCFPSSVYKALSDPPEGLLSAYSSYNEYFSLPKVCSGLSSLKLSVFEDKESFISNSELRDDFWQKLEVVTGSFSFLQSDGYLKVHESDHDHLKNSTNKAVSEDATRASTLPAVKRIVYERDFIAPDCCIGKNCSIQ